MANSVILGTLVHLTAEFRVPATDSGVPTDPTTLTLQVRVPAGSVVSSVYGGATDAGTIVKDATGFYHADYLPTTVGRYRWRWAGTGAAHVPGEGGFVVTASTL